MERVWRRHGLLPHDQLCLPSSSGPRTFHTPPAKKQYRQTKSSDKKQPALALHIHQHNMAACRTKQPRSTPGAHMRSAGTSTAHHLLCPLTGVAGLDHCQLDGHVDHGRDPDLGSRNLRPVDLHLCHGHLHANRAAVKRRGREVGMVREAPARCVVDMCICNMPNPHDIYP